MGTSWGHLSHRRDALLANCVAPNTIKTYRVGINRYLGFCRLYRINPLPLTEKVLENFCVFLSRRLSHKSIKVYLSGVQLMSTLNRGVVLIHQMPRLAYVLKAIRRVQGNRFDRPTRTPITWPLMRVICRFIDRTEAPFDKLMLTSAILLAFFGLLRVSEYTSPTSAHADDTTLAVEDVEIDWPHRVARIRIKKSKTDPFRLGVTIRIGVLQHALCPVSALERYLIYRGCQPGPLFHFRNGSYLTRTGIYDLLMRSLPHVRNVNTHSFRRGGATALAAAGVPTHVIQVMGRWKSNAYARYIEIPDTFFIRANTDMANLE